MDIINVILLGAIIFVGIIKPIYDYIKFLDEEGWKEPLAREFEESLTPTRDK